MTVNPVPTVLVISPTICAGQSATLTASGAAAYAATLITQPLASVPLMMAALFLAPAGGAVHLVAIHRWLAERGSKAQVRSARRLTSALG